MLVQCRELVSLALCGSWGSVSSCHCPVAFQLNAGAVPWVCDCGSLQCSWGSVSSYLRDQRWCGVAPVLWGSVSSLVGCPVVLQLSADAVPWVCECSWGSVSSSVHLCVCVCVVVSVCAVAQLVVPPSSLPNNHFLHQKGSSLFLKVLACNRPLSLASLQTLMCVST